MNLLETLLDVLAYVVEALFHAVCDVLEEYFGYVTVPPLTTEEQDLLARGHGLVAQGYGSNEPLMRMYQQAMQSMTDSDPRVN